MYQNDLMQLATAKDPMAPPPQGKSLDQMLAEYEQRTAMIDKMGLSNSWVGKANAGVGQGLNAMQSAMRPSVQSAAGGANIAAQAAQSGAKAASAGAGAAGAAGANAAAQKAGAASSAASAAGMAM